MLPTPESKVQKMKKVNFCKRIREKVTKNGVVTRFPHQKVWIFGRKTWWFSDMLVSKYLLSPKIIGMFGPRTAIVARGRAEQESRISIPVPAVPVSELLAGKSQRICNSLN